MYTYPIVKMKTRDSMDACCHPFGICLDVRQAGFRSTKRAPVILRLVILLYQITAGIHDDCVGAAHQRLERKGFNIDQ